MISPHHSHPTNGDPWIHVKPFGLTTLRTESSWLKKKLPRMKLEDEKIVKGYEEAGREWSGRKTNGSAKP